MNATAVIFLITHNSITLDADQTSSFDGSDIVEASVVGEPPPPLELNLSPKSKVNIVKISDYGFSLYSILLPLKCRNLIVGSISAAGL